MSGRGISVDGLAEPDTDWSRGAATPETEVEFVCRLTNASGAAGGQV